MYKLALISLFISTPLNASETPLHRQWLKDGSEVVSVGSISQPHEVLTFVAKPNSKAEISTYKNKTLIRKITYTVGPNGQRVSSASNKPNKQQHFFLINGSVSFGNDLSDDETITHWLNHKSNFYETYAIGFSNHNYQHNWVEFKSNTLANSVKHKKGRAIILADAARLSKFVLQSNMLQFVEYFPNIIENAEGNFQYVGRVSESTNVWNKFLINWCLPIAACKRFLSDFHTISEETYQIVGRLYDSINEMYRKQFDVESFKIAWIGPLEQMQRLQKYTEVPIIQLPIFEKYEGEHPTPIGAKNLADFLFNLELKK